MYSNTKNHFVPFQLYNTIEIHLVSLKISYKLNFCQQEKKKKRTTGSCKSLFLKIHLRFIHSYIHSFIHATLKLQNHVKVLLNHSNA